MQLPEALHLIREFWQEPEWPFQPTPDAAAHVARLQAEFGRPLPPWLTDYLTQAAPSVKYTDLATVGNPLDLYGLPQLGQRQDGYNFSSVTQEVFTDWPDHWFMLGDEGADPVIVDLTGDGAVTQLQHGAGNWDYRTEMAASIGQFLLCAAARQHALLHFGDAILDDAQGFRLAPEAAAWLFPRLRRWAGPYYDAWCSEFENAGQF
ncbi:MAG: SMI1/KNR4 family protein [Janthinobacterium lividum]